jgi:hypothetical protein
MAHEDLNREQHVEGPSDRSFGLVFAAVFFLIGGLPLLHGERMRWWAFVASAVFLGIALVRPSLLAGLNRLWTRLGVLLGKIVSPVALGLLYYAALTPVSIVMRLTGKDPLRLKRDASASSYWIPRTPPGPPPGSMTNQF